MRVSRILVVLSALAAFASTRPECGPIPVDPLPAPCELDGEPYYADEVVPSVPGETCTCVVDDASGQGEIVCEPERCDDVYVSSMRHWIFGTALTNTLRIWCGGITTGECWKSKSQCTRSLVPSQWHALVEAIDAVRWSDVQDEYDEIAEGADDGGALRCGDVYYLDRVEDSLFVQFRDADGGLVAHSITLCPGSSSTMPAELADLVRLIYSFHRQYPAPPECSCF